MKLAFFSTTKTDNKIFQELNQHSDIQIEYFESHLSSHTAALAQGFDAVCAFVNDELSGDVLTKLRGFGIKLIVLRCAGFNNVDLHKADELGITLLRVPNYSPMAIAEHALALMLSLNRKTYKAYNRVRDSNFSLEGLLGFDMFQKTAGVIGTGNIGCEMVRILKGLGMNVLMHDPYPNEHAIKQGGEYVSLDELYRQSDVVTLHVPLFKSTEHMINADSLAKMKRGVMLINTSRGGILDSQAVIDALKTGQIGYLGIDVYEQEAELFFEDRSEQIIQDDVFERLLTFPNVLVTAHQGFFTEEAIRHIAETTLQNMIDFENKRIRQENEVSIHMLK
ncbi:MAG: 2-hydroxyacid dehydrogenase [Hydrogenovibrio sp.]|nr:2-hydroxyacid dehydrogenase [Hydrogenovibrio sp.]